MLMGMLSPESQPRDSEAAWFQAKPIVQRLKRPTLEL